MSRDTALVSAQWVEDHLDDPNVVLVEVDEDTTAYDKGHIQGAVAQLDHRPADPVRRDFVTKDEFEELLSVAGVANDDTVVLYGGNNNWFAAYAYWVIKLYGHDQVEAAERRPQEVGAREPRADRRAPARAPRRRTRRRSGPRSARSATRSSAAIGARSSSTCARPTSSAARCSPRPTCRRSRRSAPATSRRGEHPVGKAANDDGTFKSADELKALYGDAGVTASKDVIAYCRIGERSSHSWFVLQGAARLPERQELRRLVDRVRLAWSAYRLR